METDPTRMCELLIGLPDVRLLGVVDVVDEPMVVVIEQRVPRPQLLELRWRGGGEGATAGLRWLICRASVDRSGWCGASTAGSVRCRRARWGRGPVKIHGSPRRGWD